MHPILFQVGDFKVYSYGFFVALGILVAVLVTMGKFRKAGESPQIVLDLAVVVVVFGLVGARLGYVFLYDPVFYLTHPWRILFIQEGGLAFYGALLLGLVAAVAFLRKKRFPFFVFADYAAPALALGYAIARIGCFLNGCCYGKPTTVPWRIVFPTVDELPRHPTQIYAALASLFIFCFLERLFPRRKFHGQVFSSYLFLYGASRAVIEIFREHRGLSGGTETAVFTALVIAGAGALLYLYLARRSPVS
jgi:phosphatidylglycerol:prolipoprotein diacylglycerol transferase